MVTNLIGHSDWTKATELYFLFNQNASFYVPMNAARCPRHNLQTVTSVYYGIYTTFSANIGIR